MSSTWTPIDEKTLSTTIIKNETADDDDDNSNLSNASGTTSSSSNSRRSTQNNQQVTLNTIYLEPSSTTTPTVTNINTVSSNDLQQEQYPSTNGISKRREIFLMKHFILLDSSSFSGQFIRPDQQQDQLSYAASVAYYGDDMGNGVDSLQQHHHSQNYSHLQQCEIKRNISFNKNILFFYSNLFSSNTESSSAFTTAAATTTTTTTTTTIPFTSAFYITS
jgi:hypothetical protein